MRWYYFHLDQNNTKVKVCHNQKNLGLIQYFFRLNFHYSIELWANCNQLLSCLICTAVSLMNSLNSQKILNHLYYKSNNCDFKLEWENLFLILHFVTKMHLQNPPMITIYSFFLIPEKPPQFADCIILVPKNKLLWWEFYFFFSFRNLSIFKQMLKN